MLDSIISSGITIQNFIICTAISIVLGIGTAMVGTFRTKCSQSLIIALAVLPAVVQIVIMLVNGNIGAGVAVAGAFGLVRYRSTPGTAKEISSIFLAMAVGLATGMGYVVMAVIFFAIIAALMLVLTITGFGSGNSAERVLKITIPEDMEYNNLFDDIFEKYTKKYTLEKVKTSNMGTMYELQYSIVLKDKNMPKEFFDQIRCRNGNLNIICSVENEREML